MKDPRSTKSDPDKYRTYRDLQSSEQGNYSISLERRVQMPSNVVSIIAIHGGTIEHGTSEIARSIAGAEYNYYSFEGLLDEEISFARLHLTSSFYDEPECVELVANSHRVVSVHGCWDQKTDDTTVYLGGLDYDLRLSLEKSLTSSGIDCAEHSTFKGRNPRNICNKNLSSKGLQIEFPASFLMKPVLTKSFVHCMRRALLSFS